MMRTRYLISCAMAAAKAAPPHPLRIAAMAHEIRYLVLIKLSPRGSPAKQQCYVAGDRINFVHTLKWRTLIEDREIYPDVTSP